MFESEQWIESKYGQTTSGPAYEAKKIVLSLDGDEIPTMEFIYETMERAKLAIKQNFKSYIDYWKIIDAHWNFQLHHDLHAAGYFLNHQY
ncbi:hypothetical protein MANES_10G081850v8 [Manihot esculenta]|uniref:Uncharacterized protein n=1 Tax=Manihot esculenta TaxID=3983 RepID=A0ACB7H3Y9_MANES|nr:hypothetical protein MANES_10G081850v8 [Manihot esculenta]